MVCFGAIAKPSSACAMFSVARYPLPRLVMAKRTLSIVALVCLSHTPTAPSRGRVCRLPQEQRAGYGRVRLRAYKVLGSSVMAGGGIRQRSIGKSDNVQTHMIRYEGVPAVRVNNFFGLVSRADTWRTENQESQGSARSRGGE